MLQRHEEIRDALVAQLERLVGVAEAAGQRTLAADVRETRLPKLREGRFNLVVLGEFNHGKSTFVNALLGAPILPMGITPTTAAINHVVHSPSPRARIVGKDGHQEEIPPADLARWVTVEGGKSEQIAYVEVGQPAALLEHGVTLVDTPGVNDLNEQRAEVTYGYVPRADAVIFLLDGSQALKESEREFLASRVLARSKDRMIFVIGKADLLSEGELNDVTAYVREHLARLVGQPTIFAVSPRKALQGDVAAGRMEPLIAHLSRFLAEDRGRIVLDNAAGDGLGTLDFLEQSLALKRSALALSMNELEGRVSKTKSHLAATQVQLRALDAKITAEAAAVKAQVRLDLAGFASRFAEALPAQIDAAEAGDLRRHLAGFIQDRFKAWAELEGERVAGLLERLAEEVIALANDNARSATGELGDRLSPQDTRIELDVDSFKYDLSVYAVGAIGTTVFLFVNTLVGGLLTLAAPILAIITQSRMAAEVKDHAKAQAPLAIARAQEVIAPHFAQMIDTFAAQLADYVISAGDKLYRGIGELLDSALAERRAAGSSLAPEKARLDDQLVQLAAVKSELVRLRETLWT
jgi:ribosome biogenesis GTPase A